jgi:Tfp pilus assembly protein PilE
MRTVVTVAVIALLTCIAYDRYKDMAATANGVGAAAARLRGAA